MRRKIHVGNPDEQNRHPESGDGAAGTTAVGSEATGSNSAPPVETWFVNVALLFGAMTVTVKFVVAPFVKLATGHVTRPLVNVYPAGVAFEKVTPLGKASVTVMLVAVDGPRLVSVIA